MNYPELVFKVRNLSGLSEEETVRITRATLSLLGEQVDWEEREKLASSLPRILKPLFFQKRVRRVSSEEFFPEVGRLSGLSCTQTFRGVQAVGVALRELAPGLIWEKVLFQFLAAEEDRLAANLGGAFSADLGLAANE